MDENPLLTYTERKVIEESVLNRLREEYPGAKGGRILSRIEGFILYVLEGYTQAEVGLFLRMSQQHVARLMRKIPVSEPYIVRREMEDVRKLEAELKIHNFQQIKMRRQKPDSHSDFKG